MSKAVGKGNSGSGSRDRSPQSGGRGPNRGSVRKRGELRAAEAAPWRYTKSRLPEFTPGALDAATLLKSVNDALLPLVKKELEEATERLGAVLADKKTEDDLVAVLRAELMRRVLPQFTEAVRKGVLESIRTRQMHLAQLALLHRQALDAKTLKVVLTRLEDETAKAGLRIVGDTGDQSLFNVVEEQPGVMKRGPVTFELVAPAYVDKESGKLVERGWLRAVAKVSRGDMTPGQRRRATHAQTDKKQPEKKAPVQRNRKPHRGQDAERRRNKYSEQPTGEERPHGEGKGDSPKKRGGAR